MRMKTCIDGTFAHRWLLPEAPCGAEGEGVCQRCGITRRYSMVEQDFSFSDPKARQRLGLAPQKAMALKGRETVSVFGGTYTERFSG